MSGATYAPVRAPRSARLRLRGLDTHVLTWGEAGAPTLVLLHGWMDVAASFQFLVDALERDWFVIAPDLRGFGRTAWQPQGYWFPDYLADLEALLDAFVPGEPVNLVGHSLGGNVAMQYGGIRASRVRRLVSLEGFGIATEPADAAPRKFARWLDALKKAPSFAPYDSFEDVVDRLRKKNLRLTLDKARFLARWWAARAEDGKVRLVSDPRHKLPFPTVYRLEEVLAIWRRITAPTLWIAGRDSRIPASLHDDLEGAPPADPLDTARRRLAHVAHARLETIEDAGHMLHHDQPIAVARMIEPFLTEERVAAGDATSA